MQNCNKYFDIQITIRVCWNFNFLPRILPLRLIAFTSVVSISGANVFLITNCFSFFIDQLIQNVPCIVVSIWDTNFLLVFIAQFMKRRNYLKCAAKQQKDSTVWIETFSTKFPICLGMEELVKNMVSSQILPSRPRLEKKFDVLDSSWLSRVTFFEDYLKMNLTLYHTKMSTMNIVIWRGFLRHH